MKNVGKVNYETYATCRQWQDVRGEPLPIWDEVDPAIRAAWTAAAIDAANYSTKDAWMLMCQLYHKLLEEKPNDRTDRDRHYAIAITQIQSMMGSFYLWITAGGIDARRGQSTVDEKI